MREIERFMKETSEQMRETDRRMKRTDEKIGDMTGSMGRVIEHMAAGHNIIKKFQALDYVIESYSRNKTFGYDLPEDLRGEIDLFLENGDVAILIEVKTTLKTKNVSKFMRDLEKFRRNADIKGDKRRFIGAVAGAVVEKEAMDLAHETECMLSFNPANLSKSCQRRKGFKRENGKPHSIEPHDWFS